MARVLVLAAAAAALVVGATLAQAGQQRERPRPLPGLPAYTAGYKGWIKLNARPIPPRRSGDAHSGTKNVYTSKRIVGRRYPLGTVIVKEIIRPAERFVGVVATMRKTRPSSAPNNGWLMIEYDRRSIGGRFGVLAQGSICTSCHVQVKANDYVFTRR
jgi:Cytochrome P460